jgi:hypothetical protein
LRRHTLEVPEGVVELLAKTIMRAHRHGPRSSESPSSITESLRKAQGRVRKLLVFAQKPPSRPASISASVAALREILIDGRIALTLVLTEPTFDPHRAVEDLEKEAVRPRVLLDLANVLELAISRSSLTKSGRPWLPVTHIIRAGYIAWAQSSKQRAGYGWNGVELTGPLPNFLRDLLKCCAQGKSTSLGQEVVKDQSLKDLILACKKVGLSRIVST